MEAELLRILELIKDKPYEKIMVALGFSPREPYYPLDSIPTPIQNALQENVLRVAVLYNRHHLLKADRSAEYEIHGSYRHNYWSINDSSTFLDFNVEYYDVSKN